MPAPSTLVFDGDCGICTASANWVRRHAPAVTVESHREHGVASIDKVWFIEDGRRREGADAVAELLTHCEGRTWRVAGRVIGAPGVRTIARGTYWLVARNRTRLSRLFGLKACAIEAAPRGE